MKYSVDKKEKYSLVSIDEEKVDSEMAPEIKSKFITWHAEGLTNLILDVSGVKYMDSSGLSTLLIANRLCNDESGMFVLVGAEDHVMKLIKISQLDKVLNILPTVEEGIDAVFMNELEKDLRAGETS